MIHHPIRSLVFREDIVSRYSKKHFPSLREKQKKMISIIKMYKALAGILGLRSYDGDHGEIIAELPWGTGLEISYWR
jgi:hypothetical protein